MENIELKNKKEKKNRQYAIIILLCAYLIASGIPFQLFIDNENLIYILNSILKFIFLIFAFYYIKKEGIEKPKIKKLTITSLLFIPFILISISNYFVALVNKTEISTIDNKEMIVMLIFYLFVGITEEIVFRAAIFTEINKYKNDLVSIIISSLIFGSMHLLNISSFGSIPYCVLQALYSFGFGLILAIIYKYSENIILPIILHFLFDFLNGYLIVELFNFDWDITFFIVNIIIGIILFAYGLFVYKFFNKGEKENAS